MQVCPSAAAVELHGTLTRPVRDGCPQGACNNHNLREPRAGRPGREAAMDAAMRRAANLLRARPAGPKPASRTRI